MAFGLSVEKWVGSMGRDRGRNQAEGTAERNPGGRKARACVKRRVSGIWLEPGCTEEYGGRWLGERVRQCKTLRGPNASLRE